MTLRFRTDGAWGAGVGYDLPPEEIDENFYTLDQRMDALEAGTGADGVGFVNATLVGSLLTIYKSDGSTIELTLSIPTAPGVQTISGSAVTLSSSHLSKYNRCTSATGCTITVGPDTLPVGSESHWRQAPNCPSITFIEGDTGVVINGVAGFSLGTDAEGATVTLKKVGVDEYDLFGHLATGTF